MAERVQRLVDEVALTASLAGVLVCTASFRTSQINKVQDTGSNRAAGVRVHVIGTTRARFYDHPKQGVGSAAFSVECGLCCVSISFSAGQKRKNLIWGNHYFFLQATDHHFTTGSVENLDPSSIFGREEIYNLFIVDFKERHAQEKLSISALSDVIKYRLNCQRDYARRSFFALHRERLPSAGLSVSKNGPMIPFHGGLDNIFHHRVINVNSLMLRIVKLVKLVGCC